MIAVARAVMHETRLDVVDVDPEAKLERVGVVNQPLPSTVEHDESPVVIDAPLLEPTAESHAREEELGVLIRAAYMPAITNSTRSLVAPVRLRISGLSDVVCAPGRGVNERPVRRFNAPTQAAYSAD